MLIKILLGVAALLAVLALVISLRPAAFHVERSILIDAPAEAVFAQVNDFHAWRGWSPYEKLDPNLQRRFEGAPRGVGAQYAWVGRPQVGEGRMTIERSEPHLIQIKLEMLAPFKATNTATFTFTQTPDGTKTTWAMDGENGFLGKALHLVMDADKLVGTDFERGLSSMKTLAEATSKPPVATAAP